MNTGSKVLFSLCVGAAIGATMGVLFAPHKGKLTRRKIKRDVESKLDKLSESVDSLRNKVESKYR